MDRGDVLAMLDALEDNDAPDAALVAAEAMCRALRRICTELPPGDEPQVKDHWMNSSDVPYTAAHARWQALTEVQAAILEELSK